MDYGQILVLEGRRSRLIAREITSEAYVYTTEAHHMFRIFALRLI